MEEPSSSGLEKLAWSQAVLNRLKNRVDIANQPDFTRSEPESKKFASPLEKRTKFLEEKLLETRTELAYWKDKCKDLLAEQARSQQQLQHVESYKMTERNRLLERISQLENQNERLRRKDSAETRGFQTELSLMKQKLGQLEKLIMRTQMNLASRSEADMLEQIRLALADLEESGKKLGNRLY